jgi:hypothetical protein
LIVATPALFLAGRCDQAILLRTVALNWRGASARRRQRPGGSCS